MPTLKPDHALATRCGQRLDTLPADQLPPANPVQCFQCEAVADYKIHGLPMCEACASECA